MSNQLLRLHELLRASARGINKNEQQQQREPRAGVTYLPGAGLIRPGNNKFWPY